MNVLGDANLWLDIKLGRNSDDTIADTGEIDKINSDIIGSGTLTLSKFTLENFRDNKFTTTLTFANNNTLAENSTILADSLATVITSNAGYKLELTNSGENKAKSELKNNSNPKPQKTIIKAMTVEQRTAYQHKDGKTVIKSLSMK